MIDADEILLMINKNRWKTILSELKDGNIDPYINIKNGNTLSHMASLNNNESIIKFYLDHDKSILSKSNDDGFNAYHIMAKYGYNDLLLKSIGKDNEIINLIDINGNTILHYLVENKNNYFESIINDNNDINYNIVNNNGDTILTKCISLASDNNEIDNHDDIYFNRIKLLLTKDIDLNHPKNNYPLIKSIIENKEDIAKLLIDSNADVNIKDDDYLTPFLLAIYNNSDSLANFLINKNVDINYVGPEGDNNPLIISLANKNDKIISLLLENNFNVNKYDRNMNTPLHIGFMMDEKLKPSIVSKLLFYGDLNIQNINKETPLHIFLKKYDWKIYDKILENKKMDIFIKDKHNKSPIDYISDDQFVKFIDIVTTSFINNNNLCSDIEKLECFNKTKNYILNNKTINMLDRQQNEINLIEFPNVDKGRFNSDLLHNIIYTYIILKRNKNLCIPFQYYDKMKAISTIVSFENTNFLTYKAEEYILSELVNIYNEYFFEVAPYLVLWKNNNLYYVDKNIELYTLKCLNSNQIRFIFFKLTLIASSNGTHANIIIFDKKTGILERFEPYGEIPYLEPDNLDNMIKEKIGKFLNNYLKSKNMELIYYSQKDLFTGVSFQIISNDTNSKVKKLGDPVGFCLAWTFWYLEMRIKNEDTDPKALIAKSLNKIKENDRLEYRNQLFIDFIRNYAASLDDEKNKILIEIGIEKEYVYNLQFSQKDNVKIINGINKKISDILKKRVV